jgi:hypothetical protein
MPLQRVGGFFESFSLLSIQVKSVITNAQEKCLTNCNLITHRVIRNYI